MFYGTTTSYGKSVVNSPLVSQHSITITGLCAGTYYCEIESVGTFGGTQFTATCIGSFTIAKLTCTCTTVTSSINPSTLGQPVYFTAKITPSSATGTVQFTIDGADFGSPVSLVLGLSWRVSVGHCTERTCGCVSILCTRIYRRTSSKPVLPHHQEKPL